jgi:DHA1 family multidrug resistance protein-like MFS transporter
MDPTTPRPESAAPHWRRMLYSMWLAMFFVFLEMTFAMTFAPVFLQQDIGLTFQQAEYWTGLMVALPSLAMFLCQPLWGMYADRVGRKPIVIVGIIFTSLFRALWAFAHSPWTLLALGVAAGVLGAGVIVGQAIVASAAPRQRMGETMGTLQTSMTVGFLVGPVVGQACAGAIGARPTFLIQAVLALLGAVTVWLAVEERFERPPQQEKCTLLGGLTRDLRPLVGDRQLQALWGTVFAVFFGFSAMWPILTYFVQFIGIPIERVPADAAYVMLATGALQTVLAPAFGRLGDRAGHKSILVSGLAVCGLFLIPHYFARTYGQFFLLRLLATAPGAAINPATSALVAQTMHRSQFAGAYGVLGSARALAASVGPILGGSLAAFAGIRWVFVWTGVLTLMAAGWAALAVARTETAEARE